MFKTTSVKDADELSTLVHLQILVLTLGQPKHFGWWKSEFLSPTGLRYLQRIYPRDFFWAAIRSSVVAARDAHDDAIGVKDAFHLFRLPPAIENATRSIQMLTRTSIETEFSAMLDDQSRLLGALEALSGTAQTTARIGPVRTGSEKDLAKPEIIAQVAGLYLSAFQRNVKVFPYFEQTIRKR